MNIIEIILILAVLAAGFYLVARYVTEGVLRTFLFAALGIILVVWLLSVTGVWASLARITV